MTRIALYSLLGVALVGCANDFPRNMPLVFGESITVGVSVGGSATDQGGEFTLGFKSKDVAMIPVVAYDGTKPSLVQAEVTEMTTESVPDGTAGSMKVSSQRPVTTVNKDSYSVLGQFGSTTDGSAKRVGLGKFFATGAAAQQLSQGFAECLKSASCGSPKSGDGR